MKISLYNLIGKGYINGWWRNCKCRYRVFKGARNTKKSYDLGGLEILDKILSDSRRNVLIIRNTFSSHRYSTFTTLCMLINNPMPDNFKVSLSRYFKINTQDMTITYIPTGQVILFRGFDSAQKIQSIRVAHGHLTDVYVEEAFEIDDYDEWRKIDGSIRGKLPEGLFHQITFLLNAWNKDHWIYEVYFKDRLEDDVNYLLTHNFQDWRDDELILGYGKGLYLHTSTYKINEFRDVEIYDAAMEQLREVAPEIYKVEALGMWGNANESTYLEFSDGLVKEPFEVNNMRFCRYAIGIDFGISNGEGKIQKDDEKRFKSATTMVLVGISADFNKLVAIDEFFWSNEKQMVKKTGPQLQEEMVDKIIEWSNKYSVNPTLMNNGILVYVDCADSGGFRQGLELIARKKGLFNCVFQPSTKLKIQNRVDFSRLLMAFGDCIFSKNCVNLVREIKNSRQGEKGKCRDDIDDHTINAWEYGWAAIIGFLKRWKDFKQR